MENFKNRLEIELKELDEKIGKLVNFLSTESYDNIEDDNQKHLLQLQLQTMSIYSSILNRRLDSL